MSDSRQHEFIFAGLVGTIFHPFTHAKILIQLGHEPEPPVLRETFKSMIGIGHKAYFYPSIFSYCRRIREEVGVYALFTTGLPAKLIGTIVQTSVCERVKEAFRAGDESNDDHHHREKYLMELWNDTYQAVIANAVGTIVSHPFQVIMVRQIAQFVGKETDYDTMFSSFNEILSTEGIKGFMAGLLPRLCGEVLLIVMSEVATYLLNRYILQDRVAPDIKSFSPTVSHTLVSTMVYKFTVVSNMMIVNNSRLEVAMKFASTRECYRYLKAQGALTRGGSLFFRAVPTGNLA